MSLEAQGPPLMQQKLREHGGAKHGQTSDAPRQRRHVALLFLVRDRMPHAEIWRTWIREAARSGLEVGMFVHSHQPNKLGNGRSDRWVNEHRLPGKPFDTKWGSLDLVKAELALLDRALSDRHARYERFLFASETCLPVVHPSNAMAALFGSGRVGDGDGSVGGGGLAGAAVAEGGEAGAAATSAAAAADSAASVEATGERSWVNARNFPNNGYSKQQQFDTMSIAIPRDSVWKADQWLALTRAHAAAVLTLPMSVGRSSSPSAGLCDLFRRTTASVGSDPPHPALNALADPSDPH